MTAPRIAFVFSSQGNQWPGMGTHFYQEEKIFREVMERSDREVGRHLGWRLLDLFAGDRNNSRAYMDEDRIQPVMTAMQMGLARLLNSEGIQPMAVAGLSMGELAAAFTAGVLSLEEAMRIACCEARMTQRPVARGEMAVVNLSLEETGEWLRQPGGGVHLAVELGPRTQVISGPSDSIRELLDNLRSRRIQCGLARIPFASHSPDVLPLADSFLEDLGHVEVQTGSLPFYSSITGERQEGTSFDGAYWWQMVHRPLRFHAAVRSLLRDGCGVFFEIGPHPTLGQAIGDTARSLGKSAVTICGFERGRDERTTWQEALRRVLALESQRARG
jgi:acyl transferase domain-containing protein